ncbi:MAG: hypothetical protein RL557_842 [archaeon]|jgi:DNA-3-methyladenine glycosylase
MHFVFIVWIDNLLGSELMNNLSLNHLFNQPADIVAQELLGSVIVRKINGKERRAVIVETEAYFDETDPASRACFNGDLRATMCMGAGTLLVYGVHNNWLVNIVTGEKGRAEAVLIRAVEPLNFNERCNGPGLLTRALNIGKRFHKQIIFGNEELSLVRFPQRTFEITKSFRIGVRRDLPKKLRFYIKGNRWVSR